MSDPIIQGCIALTHVTGIGSVTARRLLAHFPDPSEIFKIPKGKLLQVEGVGQVLATALKEEGTAALKKAEEVMRQCADRKITILTLGQEGYPSRLKEIPDAPIVLYTAGQAEQEPKRSLAIVGTRKNTAYGKRITQDVVHALKEADVTIVSGLAFGIDTYAHRAALDCGLPTFAVLATPLDKVYPAQNRELAIEIFKRGRLYSEYAPTSPVDARNFPMRNRIIAGLSDATLVIEAGESGGALITATLAQDYDREVFAVPGRLGDAASVGCLNLIADNKAAVFTSVDAMLLALGWEGGFQTPKAGTQLPASLNATERQLMETLLTTGGLHIDELSVRTGVGLNVLAGILLKLEFDGLVKPMPGKRFAPAMAIL